mmetsp:Transcript_46247/g.93343  ORF Transcript_46247/g.93343 Transcript_46247/m.93343 type:complete len:221 (+) Transcript_46247:404-1066(+)
MHQPFSTDSWPRVSLHEEHRVVSHLLNEFTGHALLICCHCCLLRRLGEFVPAHASIIGSTRAGPNVADDCPAHVGVLMPAPAGVVLDDFEPKSEPRHLWAQAHAHPGKRLRVAAHVLAKRGWKPRNQLCAGVSNFVRPCERVLRVVVLARGVLTVAIVAAEACQGDLKLRVGKLTESIIFLLLPAQPPRYLFLLVVYTPIEEAAFCISLSCDFLKPVKGA